METLTLEQTKQKVEKTKIQQLKDEIKKLSIEQRYLKGQRKTVNLKGKRTVDPWEAVYRVQRNKLELRHMFIAYAKLRGKSLEKIEKDSKTPFNEHMVNKIIEKYS